MMGNCREIELELTAYCSGELDWRERDRVLVHLDSCADCRAELDREMNLRSVLGSLPRAGAPGELDQRIRSAVRPAGILTSVGQNRIRLTAAVAMAACLTVAFLWPVLNQRHGPEQTWTDQEIATARREVLYSLSLTTRVLDRTQKDAVIEVFGNQLPAAVNQSLKIVKPTTPGGNG